MSIFKACDIRGVYGRDLTDEIVYRIGRALGTLVGDKCVIVGGDVRVSTPSLKVQVIDGLRASGATVLDIGIVPTPAFYFAKQHLAADAGVMVTASHNPPEFNGLKIVLGPLPITERELEEIRKLVYSRDFTDCGGSVQTAEVLASYQSFISSLACSADGAHLYKVVVDCGNGCYSGLAPAVFRSFGYPVEELFCTPDGNFPNRSPNSAVPQNLAALSRKVRDARAQIGVAFDGDGDRIAFIDDRGRFLLSDKAIVVLARDILAGHPGASVVYDLKCSSVVPESITAAGGRAIPERSGHTFIRTRMITEQAVFGGEISGHYFYGELGGGDDGLYSALLLANMLVRTGGRLSELADAVQVYENTPDIRVPFEGDRHAVVEQIAGAFPEERVSRLDGVKVSFSEGWGLARPSVTEPAITFRFEAESPARLRAIMDSFLEPVPELRTPVYEAWTDSGSDE